MEVAYIRPEQSPTVSIGSEESLPIYTFEDPIPQPPFRARNRMMRANEALSKHLFRKQTLGEMVFEAKGIRASTNMQMGANQYCYLSALGYYVVSHQKWDQKIHPGYFNVQIQIPKIQPKKKYELELDHREFKAFDVRNTRIDISVNGRIVVLDHSPASLEFVKESFDISKYLKDGTNTITISFSKNGETIYAIRSMKITES